MKEVTYKGRNTARPFRDKPDIVFSPENRTREVNEEQAKILNKDSRFTVEGHEDEEGEDETEPYEPVTGETQHPDTVTDEELAEDDDEGAEDDDE